MAAFFDLPKSKRAMLVVAYCTHTVGDVNNFTITITD